MANRDGGLRLDDVRTTKDPVACAQVLSYELQVSAVREPWEHVADQASAPLDNAAVPAQTGRQPQEVARLQQMQRLANSASIFLSIVKIFVKLQFHERMSIITATITMAAAPAIPRRDRDRDAAGRPAMLAK